MVQKKQFSILKSSLISMERSSIFTHFYAVSFLQNRFLWSSQRFFILSTRRLFTKMLDVSERPIKIMVRSYCMLFAILLTSSSSSQTKAFARKLDCKIPYKILQGLWKGTIFNYNFQRTLNFRLLLMFKLLQPLPYIEQSSKTTFLKIYLKCIKTGLIWYSYDHPVRNNEPLKLREILFFHKHFSCKIKKLKHCSSSITQKYKRMLFTYEKF